MTITLSRSGAATVMAVALAAAAAGCTESAGSGSAPTTQADNATTPAEHDEMHGAGPQILFSAALRLDLTADQRTAIENAAASLGTKPPIDDALRSEVAAGVRAGAIDEAAVLAKLDAAAPSANHTPTLASAIDTLHATLNPAQRRELVDMIGNHLDEHTATHAAMAPGAKGMLGHLLATVDLTSAQHESIERSLAAQDPDEGTAGHMQQLRAGLQAFASDHFDAAAFVRPTAMHDHVQRMLHALAAIVPVLDPAQREKLAAAIEAGPAHEP